MPDEPRALRLPVLGAIFAVVAVPELATAIWPHLLPFPTISETCRNLERRYS